MRRARPWLIGATLIASAGLVSAITPTEHSLSDPFLIRGSSEHGTTSRTLSATVTGVSFAESVVSADGDWQAEGNWLVVELTASAPRTEVDAEILLATLHIDGVVFQASERVPDSLLKTPLHVGTDTAGVLAFELASGIDGGRGELRLTTEYSTPRLDDVVAVPLSLDTAATASRLELEEPEVGAR